MTGLEIYDTKIQKQYESIKKDPEKYKNQIDPDLPFGFGAYQLACKLVLQNEKESA